MLLPVFEILSGIGEFLFQRLQNSSNIKCKVAVHDDLAMKLRIRPMMIGIGEYWPISKAII
jgi:hypothetical protein